MTRPGMFLLVLFFVSSNALAAAPIDPLAEQKRVQKLSTTAPQDPNAELRKLQDPNAELRRTLKLNNDHSIEFFSNEIKKTPKNASLYAKRGKAYSGNKDYEHALPDFEKALQLDPKQADAYVGLAVIYLTKNDYDKSWENVHQAESLGGKFWPAFMDALKERSGREK